jgi:hypothetical protein
MYKNDVYNKVIKVINSCETSQQLDTAIEFALLALPYIDDKYFHHVYQSMDRKLDYFTLLHAPQDEPVTYH